MTLPPTLSGTMMRCLRHELGARHQRPARVAQHVVDKLRLVVPHDPAADPFVERRPPALHLLDILVAREPAVQLVGHLVDEPDLHGVVVDDLLEQRGDAREDLAFVERGEQGGAQLQQHVPQAELVLERRRRAPELFVLARVLDGDRGVRREHLERLDQVQRGQRVVGRVVQVEHAHEIAVLVEERHEEVVVLMPLAGARDDPGRAAADSTAAPPSRRESVVVDEVGRADLVALLEQLVPDVPRARGARTPR